MTVFRPTCRPTKFEEDLSGRVLIPLAVNYLRRHPAGTLDARTREIQRRELVRWLAEHSRMLESLEGQELQQYKASVADVLAMVNRALGCLDDSGHAENLESVGDAQRTLAS